MKILCPKCNCENDPETASAGAIQCTACGEWFKEPESAEAAVKSTVAGPPGAWLEKDLRDRREKIRRLAKNFSWTAAALAMIAVLTLFLMVVSWKGETAERNAGVSEDHITHAAADYWLATSWCVSSALILFAVAQIIHIRANTER